MYFPRLRDLREDKDLRQQDIADYLHISQTVYSRSRIFTGRRPTTFWGAPTSFAHIRRSPASDRPFLRKKPCIFRQNAVY